MMALDRARTLRSRLSDIKEAQKYEKDADALEDKRQALERHLKGFQSSVESAGVLVKNGCLKSGSLPNPMDLEKALKNVVETFTSDPGSIAKGRIFTALIKQFETIVDQIRERTMAAWTDKVSSVHKPDESFLGVIAKLPGQRSLVDELRLASAELMEASKEPPEDENEWSHYQELHDAVKERLKKLNPDDFPQSVYEFCDKATSEGAPTAMLTDEVRGWLEKHGLTDGLRYLLR